MGYLDDELSWQKDEDSRVTTRISTLVGWEKIFHSTCFADPLFLTWTFEARV